MSEIEYEVDRAIREAALASHEVRKCGASEAASVVAGAMAVFVEGQPRTWWLALKRPGRSLAIDEVGFEQLHRCIPLGEPRCWFIPEADVAELPVYECAVAALPAILSRCFFFEYYLVGMKFDWLVIETDHNQFISCSAP